MLTKTKKKKTSTIPLTIPFDNVRPSLGTRSNRVRSLSRQLGSVPSKTSVSLSWCYQLLLRPRSSPAIRTKVTGLLLWLCFNRSEIIRE